jgi:hypothetical protein
MRRDRYIQLAACGVLVLFLFAQAGLAMFLAASVGRHKLVYADSAEKGDPPEVGIGIAMGAFRGVFVNFLWIRANELKEAGKYYEAIDLARTITRLQPRFPRVWAFHAWNLAYNISVATQTRQERWQWVRSGINLLRDEGIPANPADILLHKELAWIYLHKVQGYTDDAHKYYKRMHAKEWTNILSSPPRIPLGEQVDGNTLRDMYITQWLEPIANAYETLDELYAKYPEARELVQKIKTDVGLDLDERLLEAHEVLKSYAGYASEIGILPQWFQTDELVKLASDPKYQDAAPHLLRHVRKRVLVDKYHMEPDRMIRYTREYGPLDWRHPAAHSVYWSARGSEEALLRMTEKNRKNYDLLNTDRVTIQAIQELYRSGWVMFDVANPDFYQTLPNPDFVPVYGQILEKLTKRSEFDSETKVFSFYAAGHENLLRDSIRFLYRRGDKGRAAEYYEILRTAPWLNTNNPELKAQITVPLAEFVEAEITRDARQTNPGVAIQEIVGALLSAYISGLLNGDDEQFRSNFEYAMLFHKTYQKEQDFRTSVAGDEGRMALRPFDELAATVLAGIVEEAGVPQGALMYRRAPADLQARAFVLLERSAMKLRLDGSAQQAGSPPFEFWFPTPAGMTPAALEAFREQMLGPAPDPEKTPQGGVAPK